MNDITIDTQIMAIGSDASNIKKASCVNLLNAVLNHKTLILVVDDGERILREYDVRLKKDPASLGRKILTRYAMDDRLKKIPWVDAGRSS